MKFTRFGKEQPVLHVERFHFPEYIAQNERYAVIGCVLS